jgi:uncharacterized membrane protein YvlD (DUF360 family)
MIRFLIRTAIYFIAAFIAIIVADMILSGFTVDGVWAYFVVALIYGVVQAILAPLLEQFTRRTAPMFAGGVGIISAFVALGVTSLISGALSIDSVTTWVAAAVLVWLAGAIAAFVLPLIIVKNQVQERRS